MTPELERMLQREPTEEEAQYESALHFRAANFRRSIVLATLREAAKLVCPLCDLGYPLVIGLRDEGVGGQYEHESRGYNQGKCLADKLHATIATSEEFKP